MNQPKQGDRVLFRDDTATVDYVRNPNPEVVTREGVVNGEPMLPYVPVWSERDGGREPTTVLIHTSNILKVWRAE